jgi:hypothetical protein
MLRTTLCNNSFVTNAPKVIKKFCLQHTGNEISKITLHLEAVLIKITGTDLTRKMKVYKIDFILILNAILTT